MKKYRVWSEINLGQLRDNLLELKERLSSETKILVVVKADAYGHGAVPVGRTVLENGVHMLGVGDSTEAIELRQSGILAPILVLGALIEEEIGWIVSYDIIPTVHSMDLLGLLNEEAKRQNKRLKVHLKIDTGMTRLGARPERAVEIARKIKSMPNLELEGMATHLSSSSNPEEDSFTSQQIALFREVANEIEKKGIKISMKHIASTGAIYMRQDAFFNLVRPGAVLYGIDPGKLSEAGLMKLHPILTLKSQVTFLKTVPAGTAIGYRRTYVTSRRTRVATIPIGYNDGYPYHLGNKGLVLIQGKRAPVVGTISMDYIMIDVTQIPGVKVGNEVVLIGQQGKERITAEELARLTETSPYVITCSLGKRVRRIYV